jgi:hypothetical protein
MREDFLHYLWRYKRFDTLNLQTTDNQSVEILDVGEYNTHAGPDFFNAKIKIEDIIWVGNVEMHLSASEWLKHGHQTDKSYDSVILHVVLDADEKIERSNGEVIPCLAMRPYIKENLLGVYQNILHNEHWIPCQHHFYQVAEFTKEAWWTRLLVERLEQKTTPIESQLIDNQLYWEEIFYRNIAKNFGVKVNEQPFEMLAFSLPLLTIGKHKNSLFQIEALLFGQAGMLENITFEDEYPRQLQKEYRHLRQKFSLTPIEGHLWKYLRLRPANFPTIRIAQFAKLLHQSVHLFSKIIATKDLKDLQELFQIELTNYWSDHYTFDKASKPMKKHLGKDAVNLILINTIIPFIFLYGKMRNEETYKDRALFLLEEISPEKNAIIDKWAELGVVATSAAQTQSLLQQKRRYCDTQRCLECAIGVAILRNE